MDPAQDVLLKLGPFLNICDVFAQPESGGSAYLFLELIRRLGPILTAYLDQLGGPHLGLGLLKLFLIHRALDPG